MSSKSQTKVLIAGNQYNIFKHDGIKDKLEPGVYEFGFGPKGEVFFTGGPDLSLPEVIYGNDKVFIDHVKKSWDNLNTGLLGIGLVGEKGLGKSLTATLLAQYTKLPVIKLSKFVGGTNFLDYLKMLDQDYVFFIDEFEKIFPSSYEDDGRASQEQLLSFLDGGSILDKKVMFLVTSNSHHKISDFLKNRPSRLRYYRSYETMSEEIIKEVLDDLLEDKKFLDDILDSLPYGDINLDALIKIIEEVNLHKIPYSQFKDYFNFKKSIELNFNIDIILEDGSRENILKDHTKEIYDHQKIGFTKRFSGLQNKRKQRDIYLRGEEIEDNPTVPTEIELSLATYTESGQHTSYEDVKGILYPSIDTLRTRYTM